MKTSRTAVQITLDRIENMKMRDVIRLGRKIGKECPGIGAELVNAIQSKAEPEEGEEVVEEEGGLFEEGGQS